MTTIIGKTFVEVKKNNLGDKETQTEEEPLNFLQTIVNTTNKVKTITFPTTIKLKKNEIKVEAMLDTGASKNLLFETLVPKDDQQTLTQPVELVQYNQEKIIITKYIANIPMIINNITMTLPQTYLVPSISLYPFILGLNFVHSLQGGITIQNSQVSFHLKTTTIAYTNTENRTNNLVCHYKNKIEEIKDSIVNDYSENLKNSLKLKSLLVQAEKIGIIGEDPQKHWNRNKTICKIPIKNPDLTIKTSDIACNLVDTKEFKLQIEELLQNNLIKPSFSPHRSAAFLVRNHSEEKRGKARMIINYKILNDNTYDDAYKIPNKDSLINSIQGCKYFSQLHCKSGFWQIRLDEDSKPWTVFSCPCGLYEWNVMSFGLKNAPQIFQRMMDRIFGKYSFIHVYIDDILVFSKTFQEHIKHLELFFEELINNGLIVSRKKIKLFKKKIEFLGLELENGQVKLQEHIVQKINNFPDKLEDLKTLQCFLGLLNYARPYIKNLSQLAEPLYSKIKITGQKYFNQEDIKLVQKIKELVKNLPTLHLPLESEYKIIQTDASQTGWGGNLLALTNNLEEKLCRYCSGTFSEYQKNMYSCAIKRFSMRRKSHITCTHVP